MFWLRGIKHKGIIKILRNQNLTGLNLKVMKGFSQKKDNDFMKSSSAQTVQKKIKINPISQNDKKPINEAQQKSEANTQQIKNEQFTAEQQQLIKSYEPDQVFNVAINVEAKHNFQKDLIISKKQFNRNKKQLRASILFQDLLKSQTTLLIYDTKGKPYFHFWIKNIFNLSFFLLTVWLIQSFSNSDQKNKILLQRTSTGKTVKYFMYGCSIYILLATFYRYIKFQRRFVQKVIYDTKTQNFFITKRKIFGSKYSKQVSRYKFVYTQNTFLNKKGTNYFNLDTKEQYSIPFKQYWLKQDLFSHLIAQRIKI